MNSPRFNLLTALAALLLGVVFASPVHAAFVYESAAEFFTSADFNGDGIPDVLLLDKLTGNARVGYADGNGNLTWSSPLVTGVEISATWRAQAIHILGLWIDPASRLLRERLESQAHRFAGQ